MSERLWGSVTPPSQISLGRLGRAFPDYFQDARIGSPHCMSAGGHGIKYASRRCACKYGAELAAGMLVA
eukprot:362179-Chlamydomonas_euryale.AAC.2